MEFLPADGRSRRSQKWPDEVKARVAAETLMPGVTVNEVGRQRGIPANHVSSWWTLARTRRLELPAREGPVEFAGLMVVCRACVACRWWCRGPAGDSHRRRGDPSGSRGDGRTDCVDRARLGGQPIIFPSNRLRFLVAAKCCTTNRMRFAMSRQNCSPRMTCCVTKNVPEAISFGGEHEAGQHGNERRTLGSGCGAVPRRHAWREKAASCPNSPKSPSIIASTRNGYSGKSPLWRDLGSDRNGGSMTKRSGRLWWSCGKRPTGSAATG